MEKLNVAIADDNERMLNLLGEIVESDKDLKLVGKARNGEDIYHIIRDKQPDVVLLDLIMPKMDGISLLFGQLFVLQHFLLLLLLIEP